jgi:hypothetical protein
MKMAFKAMAYFVPNHHMVGVGGGDDGAAMGFF